MTFTTPYGQNISLKTNYCFALLTRLFPVVDPYEVITTAEAFGYLKDVVILLTVPLLLVSGVNYTGFIMTTLVIVFLEGLTEKVFWLGHLNNKIFDFFISLARIYKHIQVFQVSSIVFLWAGYYYLGWKGIFINLLSLLVLKIIINIFSNLLRPAINAKTNSFGIRKLVFNLTRYDKNFLNAYLFYAKKVHRPLKLNVYTWEMETENWRKAYNKLFSKKPKLAINLRRTLQPELL
jgi:hypothetical protein